MNSKSSLKIAAEFMATLIIMIPFCVSDAYAQSGLPHVDITKFKGEDGIEGFVHSWVGGSGDTLEMEADAFYPSPSGGGDEIQGNQLRLYVSGVPGYRTPFSDADCTPSGAESYKCSTTFDFDWITGARTYEIRLYSDAEKTDINAQAAATDSMLLVADTVGAEVKSVGVSPRRTPGGTINVNFSAEDYALSRGDKSICVGIEYADFFVGSASGTPIQTFTYAPKECSVTGSFQYDTSSLGDGDYKLCAAVADYFGNPSSGASKCADFTVDTSAPEARLDTLRIENRLTKEEVKYVNDVQQPVDVYLNLLGQDLNINSITADFTNLGGPIYSSVSPLATSIGGGEYALKWINLKIKSVQTCSFTVEARDNSGNLMHVDVPCSVGYDNEGPAVQEIRTPYQKDGVYYIGAKTNITADIVEAGAGLSRRLVYLDLSRIIPGQGRVQPDNCTRATGNRWQCLWEVAVPSGREGVFNVGISRESLDDIENPMGAPYSQSLGVDTVNPLISGSNISHAGGSNFVGADVFVRDDTWIVILEVSDTDSTFANLTGLGGGDHVPATRCWDEGGKHYCEWQAKISSSGPFAKDISFSVSDITGNSYTLSVPINVSGLDNDTSPNNWGHTPAHCYPSVDRQMTMQAPGGFRVYCDTQLTPNNYDIDTYFMEMQDFAISCSVKSANEEATSEIDVADVINGMNLVNTFAGSTHPYFSISLAETSFGDYQNFEVECGIKIFTRAEEAGGFYTYNIYPETENITMKISFFDVPYGDIASEYDDEIEDHAEEIEKWSAWGANWYDEVKVVQDYCQLYETIMNVLALLTALASALGWVAKTYKPVEAAWQTLCHGEVTFREGTAKSLKDFFEWVCAFANCKWYEQLKDGAKKTSYWTVMEALWPEPRENFYISIFSLCLPGVVYNAYKAREIECMYVYCMLDEVSKGAPPQICKNLYNYFTCVFEQGQLFNLIPFAQWIDVLATTIEQVATNPWQALGWIVTMFGWCSRDKCTTADSPHPYCSLWWALDMIGKAIANINMMNNVDGWGEPPDDMFCADLEAEYGDEYDFDIDT